MKRSFFITGTDTGVGKTEVACMLARAFRAAGLKPGVMKPVETGCPERDGRLLPMDALKLKEASGTDADLDLINPYRFAPPLAPITASELSGISIDFQKIKSCAKELSNTHDVMLVEGAGGLLTPIVQGKYMADLALDLGLPIIIVSANRLGTINHTLLTARCAAALRLKVAGIILNNPAPRRDDLSLTHNRAELERLSPAPVLFEAPFSSKNKAPFLPEEGLVAGLLRA
ncbi:MAG: dethiobiotin synthase [Deltaproteobacteria bacterium]|nr:dethiobiotin synthase [Deltaproteobacteria bacterium]MBZ0219944.1 dethiobiotin synthase [Deltaproteobacteria bacterium]